MEEPGNGGQEGEGERSSSPSSSPPSRECPFSPSPSSGKSTSQNSSDPVRFPNNSSHQQKSVPAQPKSHLKFSPNPEVMGAQFGSCLVIKWIFLIVYLTIAGMSNWAVLAYIHDFVPREALPDIVFSIIPQQDWAFPAGDALVTVCVVALLLLLLVHRLRFVVMRRVFFIAATLYVMRTVSLFVTQLPSGYINNSEVCRNASDFSISRFFSRLFEQSLLLGFQGKADLLCGDMLFSGHSLVMNVCSLTVYYYLPDKYKLVGWLPILLAYVGMFFMIISRVHYTIDVIYAYWLSNFVFGCYHSYCESDLYIDRKTSVLHSFYYMRIVGWLESDIIPGKIENSFSNPLRDLRDWWLSVKTDRYSQHQKHISIVVYNYVEEWVYKTDHCHLSELSFGDTN